jgi:hypothetical protein
MKEVTLKEWGPQLPIGILKGDKLVRDFDFRPWTMAQEKVIGEKRSDDLNQGQFASTVLAQMVTKLAGEKFGDKPVPHRLLQLNQMAMMDVLYMYVYLRYVSLGKDLPMPVICGNCRNNIKFQADLETLRVRVKESPKELTRSVTLSDGFEMGGKVRKSLVIQPSKWSAIEALDSDKVRNPGDLAEQYFISAILAVKGVEQNPLVLSEDSLSTMTKRDINFLMEEVEGNNAGPIMAINGKCDRCGTKFQAILRWEYDSFFS